MLGPDVQGRMGWPGGVVAVAILLSLWMPLESPPQAGPKIPKIDFVPVQQDIVAGLAGGATFQGTEAGTPRSTPAERSAAVAFLEGKIAELGLEPQRHDYRAPNIHGLVDLLFAPFKGTNLYMVIEATVPEAPYVVVGAHFDSEAGSPGADDNASGVALVYALADELSRLEHRQVNFLLVFFDQEEDDEVGSRVFVDYLLDQQYDLHSAHIADMVGWDSDGDRAVEIQAPGPMLEDLYQEAADLLGTPLHITRGASSDTRPFRAADVPTVGVWEEIAYGDATPHYHLPSDTYETVNFDYLASTTRLVFEVMRGLAENGTGDGH